MDITKYAILKKLAGGVGGGSGHEIEDALVTGTLTEYTNDRVTSIRANMFYMFYALTSVNFPAVTEIKNNAFSTCTGLTSVNFPMVTKVGDYAFSDCYELSSVNFPLVQKTGTYAYQSCSKLASVNFPLAWEISSGSFNYCSALTAVDFPNASTIGGNALANCSKLERVILRSTKKVQLQSTSAFNNTPIKSGTGYIYVPAALIDSYKTATNWTTYANQFRALESYTVDGTTTGELDPTKVNA